MVETTPHQPFFLWFFRKDGCFDSTRHTKNSLNNLCTPAASTASGRPPLPLRLRKQLGPKGALIGPQQWLEKRQQARRVARANAANADEDALTGLVHHSDAGSQYLSMRYTDRLVDAGIAPSVGSQGAAYDNALAESVIGLFKTEVIRRKGPWRTLEAVEFATLVWVDWFNLRRLLGPIGDIPPAEFEAQYYQQAEVA